MKFKGLTYIKNVYKPHMTTKKGITVSDSLLLFDQGSQFFGMAH